MKSFNGIDRPHAANAIDWGKIIVPKGHEGARLRCAQIKGGLSSDKTGASGTSRCSVTINESLWLG